MQKGGTKLVETDKRSGKCANADHVDTKRNDRRIIQKCLDKSSGKTTAQKRERKTENNGYKGGF